MSGPRAAPDRGEPGGRRRARVLIGEVGFALTAGIVALITMTSATASSFHPPLASGVRGLLSDIGIVLTKAEFDVVANVIMFVPLGLFLGLMLPVRKFWIGYVALPLVSAAIEIMQLFLPTRGTQITDFLANSFGAWIGLSFAWLIVTLTERRR